MVTRGSFLKSLFVAPFLGLIGVVKGSSVGGMDACDGFHSVCIWTDNMFFAWDHANRLAREGFNDIRILFDGKGNLRVRGQKNGR